MARHSSFNNLIARETYNRFYATVRAQELRQQNPAFEWEGHAGNADSFGDPRLPGQLAGGIDEPALPFVSAEGFPIGGRKSESWIESWLAGKPSNPAGSNLPPS